MLNEWKDVENFFENRVRPMEGRRRDDRRAAEAHLRAALAADRATGGRGLLTVLLLEDGRGAEALDVGRQVVRAAPDRGTAWAVLGMALVREGRWDEARTAFDTAFQRMAAAEAAPYRIWRCCSRRWTRRGSTP